MSFEDKLIENLVFGRSGLNSSVFEKLFISYSCILFKIQCALRNFCIKMQCFSKKKNQFFHIFNWSNLLLDRSKLRLKILVWIYLTRSAFDRSKLKNFQILSIWPRGVRSAVQCGFGSFLAPHFAARFN